MCGACGSILRLLADELAPPALTCTLGCPTRPPRNRLALHLFTCPQARALASTLKEINARFGKNSIMQMGDAQYGEV